jgi:DNA-binding LacI/PurR family transcriptional regulator
MNDAISLQNKLPLKEQVKDFVRDKIITGIYPPGSKILTQRKLASELKISNRTVEVALKELEIEGFLLRRIGRGTFVSDNWNQENNQRHKSNTVAVFVPNMENPLFSQFCSVIEKRLFKYGKNMLICRSDVLRTEEERYLRLLAEKEVDGVIIYGKLSKLETLLAKHGTPVINIGDIYSGSGFFMDRYQAGFKVGEYLISMGHRKIVCAGNFPESSNYWDNDRRFDGVCDAMIKYGLPVDDVVIAQSKKNSLDYTVIGAEVTERIIKRKTHPTAIVYYNDARAFGGIQYLHEEGFRVPDDFSVISFDNVSFCELSAPALSSVDLDTQKAAILAVDYVLSGKRETVKLSSQIIKRKSVKAIDKSTE